MTVYIVWRMFTPLFPSSRCIELITADKSRAYEMAGTSMLMAVEEHTVEDMS